MTSSIIQQECELVISKMPSMMSDLHRPIKVAMISVHGNPLVPNTELGSDGKGGQNVYVREVGKRLAGMDCNVTWFTRSESPDEVGVVEINPNLRLQFIVAGPQMHLNRDHLHPFLKLFIAQVKKTDFDVLLTNYWLSGYVGLKLGLPQVHIHHSMGAMKYEHVQMPEIGSIRLSVEGQLNKNVDVLVHQTKSEIELCRATNPVLIKAGVDVDKFKRLEKRQARAALGFKDNTVNVLFVGRFAPQKGIPFVIEALTNTTVARTFRLIGNYSGYEELVKKNPQFEFLGPRTPDDVALHMAASDILIMPSIYEPFGIVCIEAMAAGCCLIVTAVGGLNEIVEEGVNGFKVQPRDAYAIQVAFERMVKDQVRMKRMGELNKRYALQKHSWCSTTKQLRRQLVKAISVQNSLHEAELNGSLVESSPTLTTGVPLST